MGTRCAVTSGLLFAAAAPAAGCSGHVESKARAPAEVARLRCEVVFKRLSNGRNRAWSVKPGAYGISARYAAPETYEDERAADEIRERIGLEERIWVGAIYSNRIRVHLDPAPRRRGDERPEHGDRE